MNRVFFVLAALLLVHPAVSAGGTVTVTGNAPSYRNTKISFYKTSDWITGTENLLGECRVSEKGDFKVEIS
jgi:hypothetical protein